jgi:hypothetical protein
VYIKDYENSIYHLVDQFAYSLDEAKFVVWTECEDQPTRVDRISPKKPEDLSVCKKCAGL